MHFFCIFYISGLKVTFNYTVAVNVCASDGICTHRHFTSVHDSHSENSGVMKFIS